jgi:hypothetical protein
MVCLLCFVVWRSITVPYHYSEQEISEMLEKYNEDYAYLRRQLVEHGLMAREGGGGDYWMVE